MSVFTFIDKITEVKKNESLTAFFTLRGDEEFLLDHFKGFPVMPGVLEIESLKQAALSLMVFSGDYDKDFFRLAKVSDVKFGQFVKPGQMIRVFVELVRKEGMASVFNGRIDLAASESGEPTAKALTAELRLEPVRWTAIERREYIERLKQSTF